MKQPNINTLGDRLNITLQRVPFHTYLGVTPEGAGDPYFGNKEIGLDIHRLKADIANKEISGIRIIDNPTMKKIFERRMVLAQRAFDNSTSSTRKDLKGKLASAIYDLGNTTTTNEVLIKGIIPNKYLTMNE